MGYYWATTRATARVALVAGPPPGHPVVFFIFIFFIFVSYKNIFLFLKFIGIYPGRPAAGRQGNFCRKAPGGPVARQRGGRPPRPPGSGAAASPPNKGVAAPTPSFASLKIQKKRKEREGGRGGVRERQSGEALSDFQAGDFR